MTVNANGEWQLTIEYSTPTHLPQPRHLPLQPLRVSLRDSLRVLRPLHHGLRHYFQIADDVARLRLLQEFS